jgi:hypothetical protein
MNVRASAALAAVARGSMRRLVALTPVGTPILIRP